MPRERLRAVMCNGAQGTCKAPTPKNGITVYAHRIPASYWAPCFAVTCSAGTGPGASMYFALENSARRVIAGAFADEAGYTFTGLSPAPHTTSTLRIAISATDRPTICYFSTGIPVLTPSAR